MAIQFYLNDALITLDAPRADQTVLDFLRDTQRMKGSKEGCREGDCGACTVLIGRLEHGELRYVSLNACIAFVPMLHRAHLVTIEALSADGALHWVQEALTDHHGSQCGFCTPGIVMSLYSAWMNAQRAMRYDDWQVALQGNLCRCTGYASILRGMMANATQELSQDPLVLHRDEMRAKLDALSNDMVSVEGDAPFFIPQSLSELEAVYAMNPNAKLVGGATDVGLWVTKGFREIAPVIFLHDVAELNSVDIQDDAIELGAMLSIEDAARALDDAMPELRDFWPRFAGPQIRHHGTIGGSLANGSPIGDTAPILIALDAVMVLNHGGNRREIAVEDFFIDYGKQDRKPGEFVERITIPRRDVILKAYKTSKRPDEDISAVMAAIALELDDATIKSARIAYGGMAATPKRATNAEKALAGSPASEDSFREAMRALEADFTPISDMRASADYRMKVAQNNLLRAFHEIAAKEAAE